MRPRQGFALRDDTVGFARRDDTRTFGDEPSHLTMISAMRLLPALLLLLAACTPAQTPAPAASAVVLPGIDVFMADIPSALKGKRVGLITNPGGINRAGQSDIDLIAGSKDLKLVALFAAEHGIRGVAAAGAHISDEVDAKTGVPVHSLYGGEDRGPTPEMLKDVDAIIYDL